MYRMYTVFLVIFVHISCSISNTQSNSSTISSKKYEQIPYSCIYCEKKICRCSMEEKILNCSSYLLNLTMKSSCTENFIWNKIDFSYRNFEIFDSKSLLSLRTSILILKSNLITSIDGNAFDSISDQLTELNLEMNQISTISSTWLNSKLIHLKTINLAYNQIESLIHLDNVNLPNLQILNLSYNQIDLFPSQIQQWTSLVKLDLSFNKMSSVPRYALIGLDHLTWLSLASNRNLSCIIQDSFKYLRRLKHLDLSSTNIYDLDGCMFIHLVSLRTLKIERVSINCSSCWLSAANKNSIKLYGQCFYNLTLRNLHNFTHQQLENSCSKSSIDCSSDYCEPGSLSFEFKELSHDKLFTLSKTSDTSKSRTIEIVLGVIFSLIGILIIIFIVIIIYRFRKGKSIFCCRFLSTNSSKMAESIRRRRHRQHQEQIINKNPTVIESIVTHGANMNVPPYSHYDNNAYIDETRSHNKRNLYNPMFNGTTNTDVQPKQIVIVSDGTNSL